MDKPRLLHVHLGALLHCAELVQAELCMPGNVAFRRVAATVLQVVNTFDVRIARIADLVCEHAEASACIAERKDLIRQYTGSLQTLLDAVRKGEAAPDFSQLCDLSCLLNALFTEMKVLLEAKFL